jgi:hypothetical protein
MSRIPTSSITQQILTAFIANEVAKSASAELSLGSLVGSIQP